MSDSIKLLGKDGKLVPVPPDQVQHALENGFQALKGSSIPMKDDQGVTRFVPSESALQGLQHGWKISSKEESKLADAQQSYGPAAAAALGFAKGAPAALGISTERAVNEVARYSHDFKQEVDPFSGPQVSSPQARALGHFKGAALGSPIAALGGEIAGFAAPALLTGGGLSALAEEGLVEAGASKGLAKIGAFGAENALAGYAGADSEAALENEELTAQHAVAGAGFGFLLGGVAGAGAHGLETAAGRILGRFGRGGGVLARGEMKAVEGAESAALKGVAEEATGYGRSVEDRAIRQAGFNDEKITSRIQKEVFDAMTELHEKGFEVSKETYGAGQRANVNKLIGDAASPGVAERVNSVRGQAIEHMVATVTEHAEATAEVAEAKAALRRVSKGSRGAPADVDVPPRDVADAQMMLERAQARLAEAQHPLLKDYGDTIRKFSGEFAGKDAEGFHAMRELKTHLFEMAKRAKEAAPSAASHRDELLLKAAAGRMQDDVQVARSLTHSEELFGRAGAAERDIAEARARQKAAEKTAFPGLGMKIEEPSGRDVWKWDPKKVANMLRDAANMDNPVVAEFQKWLQATHDFQGRVTKHYGTKAPEVAALQGTAGKIGAAFEEAQIHAQRIAKLDAIGVRPNTGGTSNRGVVMGLMDPGVRMAMLSRAERVAMDFSKRSGIAIDEFFVSGSKTRTRPSTTAFLKGAGGERATFERTVEAVLEANENPQRVAELVGSQLPSARAGVGFHTVQTMTRGLAYLVQHMPSGMQPDPSLAAPHLEKPLYSDAEMRVWARRAAAIDQPLTVLEHLAQGIVVDEEIDALREVYPDLYARVETALRLGLADRSKPALTRQQKLQLSVVFGQPVDASMTVDCMRILQMSPAGRAGKGGKAVVSMNGRGVKAVNLGSALSESSLTDAERLAKR